MARTATLSQLIEDIREQSDTVGATSRHTQERLKRLVNQSIQRFRERVSLEGSQHFLASVDVTVTAGTGTHKAVDLSSADPVVTRVFGVDLQRCASDWVTLSHEPFTARLAYPTPGEPQGWFNFETRKIAIIPAPSQSYTLRVWYLPTFDDLVADSDTFDGVSGWEEYVVWDVVCRTILRDQYPEAFAMAQQYRAETWADILRSAARVTGAGGAVIGRDSMGARAYVGRSRMLPPP